MSGIFGALSLDGGEQSPAELGAMATRLARRGPDGTRLWHEGAARLGHTLLATTPEALIEKLPLTDSGIGCTITADVRLDNREELLPALGLEQAGRVVGDGELILRAYLRWGEDCPKHLLGDFAFAIWDPRSQQLFCARDHMGMRQLIYHHDPGRHFVFSTEVEAVLAFPGVPRRINEGRIADFLDGLEGIDLTSTYYEEVIRLPPAHRLTVGASGLDLRRYWQLQPVAELKLDSDEAYAKAFLDVFTEAVRCRLRSPGPVGSMLSGGMDSGSVTAIAAKLLAAEDRGPLRTFSAIGPDPECCAETAAILAAQSNPGIEPTSVSYADLGDYGPALARLTEQGSEPVDGSLVLVRAMYLAAHRHGMKVILDGVAGDLSLWSGDYVGHLLRKGAVLEAWREARGEERFWGPSWPAWQNLLRSTWSAFLPATVRLWRHRLAIRFWQRSHSRSKLIAPQFARRIRLRDRRKRLQRERLGNFRQNPRLRAATHANLVIGRESYDRIASEVAVEPRDPFTDIRLIQFCLSLPRSQLQKDGWPKAILRRAMRQQLPKAVLRQVGKPHLGWKFITAVAGTTPRQGETIRRYVDLDSAQANSENVDPNRLAEWIIAVYLQNWLEFAAGAKVEPSDP